ncbi:MAG: hypothetical protein ABW046_22310 [Actinoplanes sp.]
MLIECGDVERDLQQRVLTGFLRVLPAGQDAAALQQGVRLDPVQQRVECGGVAGGGGSGAFATVWLADDEELQTSVAAGRAAGLVVGPDLAAWTGAPARPSPSPRR